MRNDKCTNKIHNLVKRKRKFTDSIELQFIQTYVYLTTLPKNYM